MSVTTITTKTGRYEAVRTGTIKVGRWVYPVIERTDGVVVRNEKTDGSQGFNRVLGADAAKVTWDAPVVKVAPVKAERGELSPLDKAMLAQIGNSQGKRQGDSFDFFDDGIVEHSGIWFAHAADQTSNPPAARRAFKSLANKGYLEISDQVDSDAKDRWMWLTAKGATAALEFAGQSTELPEFKAGHTTGGGNQSKKPGRSTWKVGDPCPQGHKLEADDIYTMPSGRRQCRKCRAGMPSRQS